MEVLPVRKPLSPALESHTRAPKGEPLTDEERAELEEARRTPAEQWIPHAEILAELAERIRRGE
jgi:hypothetical protein